MRMVVLVSGSGTNLQALLDDPDLGRRVDLVVSDRPGVTALDRARHAGVALDCIELGSYATRPAWEAALADRVTRAEPDLVVLAGFMRVLSGAFVRRWTTMNVHPSLLPAFPGAHAVADALAHGVKVTGVTVHLVDERVDHGPIIAQEPVVVREGDTPASLHARIQAVEHRLLPRCVRLFAAGRLSVHGRRVKVEV